MAALLDSLSEGEIFSTHKDAAARWMNSENEIFSAHKDAVARWMNRFIHENMYFEDEAKTVSSVLGVTTDDVFCIATRIIRSGALSAEEEQN